MSTLVHINSTLFGLSIWAQLGYHCLQVALILEANRIRLHNIIKKSWEPETLYVTTAGKQWLCTPCRTALLAVHHDAHLGAWQLDAYALEAGGSEQPLFWTILENQTLPEAAASLPAEVCAM